MSKIGVLASVAAMALLPLASPAHARAKPAAAAPADACDRRCLLSALTEYGDGMLLNTTSRLKVAADVRVTYNGMVGSLGKSEVWGQVKRLPYRLTLVDAETGTAAMLATLTNGPTRDAEKWWFFVVRLKIAHRQITEVEEIAFDGTLGGIPASTLHEPDRIFDTLLPEEERVDRTKLFDIANQYFDAVSKRVDYHSVPWHPECQRLELGAYTVNSGLNNGSCGTEFEVPRVKWNVENRRFYIADVQRGVVAAMGNFTTPPEYPNNNGSVVFEIFKVQDGMIRHIEAFFRGNGQLHSGWGTGPGS